MGNRISSFKTPKGPKTRAPTPKAPGTPKGTPKDRPKALPLAAAPTSATPRVATPVTPTPATATTSTTDSSEDAVGSDLDVALAHRHRIVPPPPTLPVSAFIEPPVERHPEQAQPQAPLEGLAPDSVHPDQQGGVHCVCRPELHPYPAYPPEPDDHGPHPRLGESQGIPLSPSPHSHSPSPFQSPSPSPSPTPATATPGPDQRRIYVVPLALLRPMSHMAGFLAVIGDLEPWDASEATGGGQGEGSAEGEGVGGAGASSASGGGGGAAAESTGGQAGTGWRWPASRMSSAPESPGWPVSPSTTTTATPFAPVSASAVSASAVSASAVSASAVSPRSSVAHGSASSVSPVSSTSPVSPISPWSPPTARSSTSPTDDPPPSLDTDSNTPRSRQHQPSRLPPIHEGSRSDGEGGVDAERDEGKGRGENVIRCLEES